jgi:hypothetical protein
VKTCTTTHGLADEVELFIWIMPDHDRRSEHAMNFNENFNNTLKEELL